MRREELPPHLSSSEDPPGSGVPGATLLETPFASPSAVGLHAPARRPQPRPLEGEANGGLERVAGVRDGRRGASASITPWLEEQEASASRAATSTTAGSEMQRRWRGFLHDRLGPDVQVVLM